MSKSLTKVDPARAMVVAAENDVSQAVSRFAEYVDADNNHATSPGGMRTSINVAIKRHYGYAVDDMPRDMWAHLHFTLAQVASVINQGIEENEPRATVKERVRELIKTSAESYHAISGRRN